MGSSGESPRVLGDGRGIEDRGKDKETSPQVFIQK